MAKRLTAKRLRALRKNLVEFREQVQAERKRQGWALRRLAAESGVSVSMLSRFENGKAEMTLTPTLRVMIALGLADVI